MNGAGVRVGCDVVDVASIEASISAFGERYLERIFTPLEQLQAGSSPERIAARFAGKEAVMKILRPTRDDAIPYRHIEIALLPSGAPHVRLAGAAKLRAQAERLQGFAVSLSHDHGVAFATALAMSTIHKDRNMTDAIRNILSRYGNLRVSIDGLSDADDLYEAGLASHASINVMLAIEDELDVEFADELMTRSTFSSIASITATVDSLVGAVS
ncbi:MAG: hypothetical protein JWN09_2912 [Microbacteriaceae bacterium]|jgi:holo-[acyl-carrier protein] synthase|nr:hypothetical protein [Microbacteriaceae bacterium]